MDIQKADSIYLDCFSGMSGDMFLGAMLDLGYPQKELFTIISLLKLPDTLVTIYKDHRLHIHGTGITINDEKDNAHSHHHVTFSEIRQMIDTSGLDENVKKVAIAIFQRIAKAEAKIHGQNIDNITFHEVGAIDSIIDIVAAASIKEYFKNSTFISTSPKVGHGFMTCKHGTYPVPSPATLEILKEIPFIEGSDRFQELITPTGAAILVECCDEFRSIPRGKIIEIGYGIGQYNDPNIPNVLRVIAMKREIPEHSDMVQVIETQIDDMNPEWLGHMMDQLFDARALDVFYSSIFMKKNRPGILVTVLCERENLQKCTEIIFKNSTTMGLRIRESTRITLKREIFDITTPYGKSKVKIGYFNGAKTCISPEYEACRLLSKNASISIKEAYEVTLKSYYHK